MNTFKEAILAINNNEFSICELVTILELTTHKLNIETISEMARKENKSPNGILKSKQYKKILISKQKFAIKGVKEDDLPF